MPNPKCKVCGKELNKKTAYCNTKLNLNGCKNKREYYCSEEEYLNNLIEKNRVKTIKDAMYQFVKTELLNYDKNQILPNLYFTSLSDLLESYDCEVIFETFAECKENILYAFNTKRFKNESAKINYMMAIIRNSINDVYSKWKKREEIAEDKSNNCEISEGENLNMEIAFEETPNPIKKDNTDNQLTGLFDEDELQ